MNNADNTGDDDTWGSSTPPPWPSAEHDLRRMSGDERGYSFIAWQQGRGHGMLGRIMGFRRAAEILAAQLLSSPFYRDADTVVFPFAMCWRHYVELQLKSLIPAAQRLLGEPVVPRGGHNIKQLWSELRPLLIRISPHEDQADIKVVDRVVRQFAELDPAGEDFRYAERRDRTPSLDGVKHLDISEFHKAMLGVAHFFEAVDTMIDHEQDQKNEYLQYMWEQQQEYEVDYYD